MMNLLLFTVLMHDCYPAKNAQNIITRLGIVTSHQKGGWGAQRKAKKVGGGGGLGLSC
jgi:hypothetical protein